MVGGLTYPIKVSVEDAITGDKIDRFIIAQLNLKTNWRAKLVKPVTYTLDKEHLPDFEIQLINNCHRTELFEISLDANIRLSLASKGNHILLRPGRDTLIKVSVRSRNIEQINEDVKVIVKARNGIKVLYQKLYIVSNEYKAHEFNRYYAPLEIGWQGINLARGSAVSQLLSAYGTLKLDNNKDFSIRTQLNFIDGEYDKYNSNYFGKLTTRNAVVEVGNIDDFMYSQIMGIGSRVILRRQKNSYEAFAMKSQFHAGNLSGLRHQVILTDKSNIETEALFEQNKETGISSFFAAHSYNLSFSSNGKLKIKAGYSAEKAKSIGNLEKGSLVGYSFVYANKRAMIYSNVQYFSKWFPGFNRGMISQNYDLRFNLGHLKIGGYCNQLIRTPQVYNLDYSDSYQINSNVSKDYGLQLGLKVGKSNLLLKGGNTYQFQGTSIYKKSNESLVNHEIKGKELILSYNFNNSRANHFISVSAISSSVDEEIKSDGQIESYNVQMNGRYKAFSYSMKYDRGPNYYFDYMYLQRTGMSPIRKQMSIFWHSINNKLVQNRVSLNYFDMSVLTSKSLLIRDNLDLHVSEKGWRFGINASFNLLNIKATPFVSLSLTKALNVPVPFLKRYNNLTVRMFKDVNNNDKWDKGEQAIKDAKTLIKGKYLNSNENGETRLKNIEKGDF